MPNFYAKTVSVGRLNSFSHFSFKLSMHPPTDIFLLLCTENRCRHNWAIYALLLQNTACIMSYSRILGAHNHPASPPSLARTHAGRFFQLAAFLLKCFWLSNKILSPCRTSHCNTSEWLNPTGTGRNGRKRSPQRRSCWRVWWQCLPEALKQRCDHRS